MAAGRGGQRRTGGRRPGVAPAAVLTGTGVLNDVVAITATNAWAVGHYGGLANPKTLVEHWNGAAWHRISVSPAAGWLNGVAATSARDVWAVGFSGRRALILHFDGTTWRRAASPVAGMLADVTAISPHDAWVAGITGDKTLLEHWDGTTWQRVPSPSPGTGAILYRVTAISASDAWATGSSGRGTLILHWNGTAWRRARSPAVRSGAGLIGISGTSRNLWAVGATGGLVASGARRAGFAALAAGTAHPARATGAGPTAEPLILHWNGAMSRRVSIPVPATGAMLIGVHAASGRNAWAVGCTKTFDNIKARPLVLHWNGTAWK